MEEKKPVNKKIAKVVRRSFILGFALCLALVILLTKVFNCGALLVGKEYKQYKGLEKSYGKYYEIISLIDEEALADYEPEEVTDDVLKNIVASLDDPYAEYFTAEEYASYIRMFSESYVGIGCGVADYEGEVFVYTLVEDGPAEKAGVEIGDVILKIDGKKIQDSTQATTAIAGDPGTEVELLIKRYDERITLKITREKIEEKSVKWEEYDKDKGIAYISISMFKEDTAKDLKLAVKDLKNQGYTSAIIDLRDNGGGRTAEAYKVADFLLPECKIDTEVDKKGKETVHNSKPSNAGIKYVLLVNENTASASEIVAAAVQDNKGGKILGTRTYGKGVTQKTHKFEDGSALKITVEEYFRPSGKKVDGVGIKPDIVVKNDEKILKKAEKELS